VSLKTGGWLRVPADTWAFWARRTFRISLALMLLAAALSGSIEIRMAY